ncbi:MAG: PRC-barrel domain-containing protein [Coriobacteriales bacterium]|jgi:uncharacterized protein YrrD
MRTISEMKKAVVMKGDKNRKMGKIRYAVFHPTEPRLVGFIIHRHDTAGMIKHDDRFLAYDSFKVRDGRLRASMDKGAWDDGACERLGVDFDKCVVWRGMPVETENGESFGKVEDVSYDETTGKVLGITTDEGPLSNFLIGKCSFEPEMIIVYRDGRILLTSAAAGKEASGGAAAKAGEAAAKISNSMKEKGPKAAKSMDDAVQKGARKLGEGIGEMKRQGEEASRKHSEIPQEETLSYALGKQLGKARGMFEEFKEEYNKEAHRDD